MMYNGKWMAAFMKLRDSEFPSTPITLCLSHILGVVVMLTYCQRGELTVQLFTQIYAYGISTPIIQ